jgi:NADH-quinone oxidoreductase subunit G
VSAATAAAAGVADGEHVTVATEAGSVRLPVLVTDMPDRVVWLPTNAVDCAVRGTLHADAGDVVRLTAAGPAGLEDEEVTA